MLTYRLSQCCWCLHSLSGGRTIENQDELLVRGGFVRGFCPQMLMINVDTDKDSPFQGSVTYRSEAPGATENFSK